MSCSSLYGEKEAAFSKVTEKLKEHANNDTIEKIEKAKFAGYVKGRYQRCSAIR